MSRCKKASLDDEDRVNDGEELCAFILELASCFCQSV